MSKSYKPYAFAVLALAGVYSAQLTVDFMPQYDVIRSIAQEEVVELTAENVMAELEKHRQFLVVTSEKSSYQLADAEKTSDVSKLEEISKEHKKLHTELNESHRLFKLKVENFLSAQAEDFDRSAIEELMANLDEKHYQAESGFNFIRLKEVIAEAKEKRAKEHSEKIASLENMLCEQRQSIADLKEELSSKLSSLTELLTGRSFISSSPLTSPDFAMPWANLQAPFTQMFNPFSFLFGGASQFQGFGQMPQFGLTQNNFYGKTSFESYSFKLPTLDQVQAARGPSQAQPTGPQQPPQQLVVPVSTRGLGHSSEAVVF